MISLPLQKRAFVFFLLAAVLACKKDGNMAFETVSYDTGPCSDCPKVVIDLPKSVRPSRLGNAIDHEMAEKVTELLSFDETQGPKTIDTAIQSFTDEFKALREKFPSEPNNWEARIHGTVSYAQNGLTTIQLDSYMYTGGAHGDGSIQYLTFDSDKANLLRLKDLFTDWEKVTAHIENRFREQEHIPNGQNINSTGFMFNNDIFHLPENMGFTKNGLHLIYNQYEVASYADGPIELLLPFGEINPFLTTPIH
ncbi:MAG: DUF3298 domain-containing protein [Flavobacteriaceae bacterium]